MAIIAVVPHIHVFCFARHIVAARFHTIPFAVVHIDIIYVCHRVERHNHHKIVLAIKPGITGLAQISGRSNLDFEEEIKLDTFYIENWNLFLDLIIILKTPFIVLKRDGAII